MRFLPGHCRDGKPLDYDWSKLADPDCTLAIYMGLSNLSLIADELIKAGLPADMPAAAVQNGTTPRQRRVLGTLATLPALAQGAGLKAPTLIIVGRVVSLAGALDWFHHDGNIGQAHQA